MLKYPNTKNNKKYSNSYISKHLTCKKLHLEYKINNKEEKMEARVKAKECNKTLLRIFPKINLDVINSIIDELDIISNIRKNFYKKIIKMRYDIILKSKL